jgi:hypothetical protein
MVTAEAYCSRAATKMFVLGTDEWGMLNRGEKVGAMLGWVVKVLTVGTPGRETI